MGACTPNIYKTVKKEYGDVFVKYIVEEESVNAFQNFFKERLLQYDDKVQNKRVYFHSQIQYRESRMIISFNEIKDNLNNQLPGGVASFQQMKQASIQRLLGLNEYQKMFQGLHDQVNREVDTRKQKIHLEFQSLFTKSKNSQHLSQQQLKTLFDLPQQKRDLIYQSGVKDFRTKIDQRVQEMQILLSQKLNISSEMQNYQSALPLQIVDNLVSVSKNKFKTQALMLAGGFFDDTIQA